MPPSAPDGPQATRDKAANPIALGLHTSRDPGLTAPSVPRAAGGGGFYCLIHGCGLLDAHHQGSNSARTPRQETSS